MIKASSVETRARDLLEHQDLQRHQRVDRMFLVLMIVQWLGGLIATLTVSPYTWIGEKALVHVHVSAVLLIGGLISGMPIFMIVFFPGRALTRHVIAISQALWSALLIHASGGRIETHFHIFGSLAFIAFYRDWRVLVTMSAVVATDHAVRGILWPMSVYGVAFESPYRWIEHAAWVVFEAVILLYGCHKSRNADRTLCEQQATLEATNDRIEEKVRERSSELRDAKDFFQSVLDSMQSHICVLDESGTIVETNAVWDRFALSNQAKVSIGTNYLDVCRAATGEGAEGAQMFADAIEQVILGAQGRYSAEYPCHSAERQHWYQVEVTPLQQHARGAAVVAHTDVTDRVIAQQKFATASRDLQKAAREAGKSEVASSVLHNVGNVMNSLNVSAQLLADTLENSPTDRLERVSDILGAQPSLEEFFTKDTRGQLLPKTLRQLATRLTQDRECELHELNCILHQVDHIKHIVKKQQALATQKSCLFEDVRIESLIEDSLRINESLQKRSGVKIRRDMEEQLNSVRTDKHRVLQILVNLIANAIQAAHQKGTSGEVVVSLRRVEDAIRIQVSDNGVGISQDNLTKIFQYGFTTKPNGHGFGLHSCALEAETLGGSLSVASEGENQGAVFTLQLPVHSSAPTKQKI